MKPEQLLYARIAQALHPIWDTQRIETTTARGIPDITACSPDTGDVWIEAKWDKAHKPKPKLRPEQYAWMKKRVFMGGSCCALMQDLERLWHIWPIENDSRFVSVGSYLLPTHDHPHLTSNNLHGLLSEYYARPKPDRHARSNPST